MHWLATETAEHSQRFVFGKLESGNYIVSCLL